MELLISALEKQTQRCPPGSSPTTMDTHRPRRDAARPRARTISCDVVLGQLFGDGGQKQGVDEFGEGLVLASGLAGAGLAGALDLKAASRQGFAHRSSIAGATVSSLVRYLPVCIRIISPVAVLLWWRGHG